VPAEREVREEIAHHVELRTRDLIAAGLSPADARREAERRFGDIARLSEEMTRLARHRNRTWARVDWWAELLQDTAIAWRQCRVRPGFALAAILTLALGLGATTAIFSVVHAVVLKPFAYPDPDRVLLVYTTFANRPGNVSVGNYDYIRRLTTTIEHVAALQFSSFNLADGDAPERVQGARVTWNYFAAFAIPPIHGRTFREDEDRPGAARVAVLSERLWERRFGADPSVVGRTVRMSGQTYEVIGVMPASVDDATWGAEVWVPIAFTPERLGNFDEVYLTLFGRQRTDVSLSQVNDDLARIAEGFRRDHPEHNRDRRAEARVLGTFVVGNYRTRLFVLLAAVGLVLAIACGNVANLLLARLAARSRELAIRAALGAGRGRIVRQVLAESLLLSACGGLAGLLVAWWSIPALVALAPAGVPRLESAVINGTVLAAALGLVVLSTVMVGLVPAWQATRRVDLREDLGDGKGAPAGVARARVRQALVAAQAALVVVVLSAAALLLRSAVNLQQVDLGFDTGGVLAARVALPDTQDVAPAEARQAFARMLDHLRSAPGVAAAALDSQPPLLSNGSINGLIPEGRSITDDGIMSQSHFITPDYFSTLRIPLLEGRPFNDRDVREAPLVMILNRTLARTAFGDQSPLGRRMICCEGTPENPAYKIIVGVVADVHGWGPAEPPRPEFYLPLPQIPDAAWWWIGRSMHVLTRGDDPGALAGAIRAAVREVDASLPVFAIRTMNDGRRQALAQSRFNTTLMSLLGATGLGLSALGVYSVLAWLVAQRSREIGVRMALGASARDVVTMVTLNGLKPVGTGLAVGVAGALAGTGLLEGELFRVGPRDPIALGATLAVLVVVASLAAALPAWRAARIDPVRALNE
jgi:predicted permease